MANVFDISKVDFGGGPYAFYRSLRDEAPIAKLSPFGFFTVSRYEHVVEALRNSKQLSNKGYTVAQPPNSPLVTELSPSIAQLDAPQHTRLRNIVSRAFTPRMIAQLEPRIRDMARQLLDAVVPKGEFEFASEVAIPLPISIIAELLGIGQERRADFKRWSDTFISSLALHQSGHAETQRQAIREMREYFTELIEIRRVESKDDLMGTLVRAEVDGERLTTDEVISFTNLLLIAGNETTTSLLGSAMVLLTDNPEQLADVIADPALIPNAIEEALRCETPIQCLFRLTLEDVDIAGEQIPAGSIAIAIVAAANRDERRFPDPDRFDIRRDTQGHLAFGLGVHTCLGASLARLEARVLLEELFARVKHIERRHDEVKWVRSFLQRSVETLDIRVSG